MAREGAAVLLTCRANVDGVMILEIGEGPCPSPREAALPERPLLLLFVGDVLLCGSPSKKVLRMLESLKPRGLSVRSGTKPSLILISSSSTILDRRYLVWS